MRACFLVLCGLMCMSVAAEVTVRDDAVRIILPDGALIQMKVVAWDRGGRCLPASARVKVRLVCGERTVGGDLLSPVEGRLEVTGNGDDFRVEWNASGDDLPSHAILFRIPRKGAVPLVTVDGRNLGKGEIPYVGLPSWVSVRAGATRLFVEYRKAYRCRFQDASRWQDASYHLLVYPVDGRCTLLFSSRLGRPAPVVLRVEKPRRAPRAGEMVELPVELWARYDNPFDPRSISLRAEIFSPDGERMLVGGFIYQRYERVVEEGGRERYVPKGAPYWMVRFLPFSPGDYLLRFRASVPYGVSRPLEVRLRVGYGSSRGVVRVDGNRRTFVFRNGQRFFPIGHNVCWTDSRRMLSEFEYYFRRMAESGENYTRVWLCSWGIGLDGKSPDRIDLLGAWKLDAVLRAALENGIYVKLCLENFWDFTHKKGPYWKERGGWCTEPGDFFSGPRSLKWAKRKYGYIVNRYSAYPSLFAWELWNEMDYALTDERLMVSWTNEMGRYLKSIDPYDHPLTTSLGVESVRESLWRLDVIDFAQVHLYIRPQAVFGEPMYGDSVELLGNFAARLRPLGKPFLLSEYGFSATNEDQGMNAVDKRGVHLHNALWASVMQGYAGTAAAWWWDLYIDKYDLYHHYAALASFIRGEEGLITSSSPVLIDFDGGRVLGLRKDGEKGLFWIQAKDNDWRHVVAGGRPLNVLPSSSTVRLGDWRKGKYLLEWWNTYDGGVITRERVKVEGDGVMRLCPPAGFPDVALKVKPLSG